MYLKIKTDREYGWKIFGGIKRLNYSFCQMWTYDHYRTMGNGGDFIIGPLDEEEWNKECAEDGTQPFAHANLRLEDGSDVFVCWNTTAFLLNEEGKTIEVIRARG